MKAARFIASKTFQSSQRNFSALIIRLSAAAVAVSIAVMTISLCIISGFRNQVSEKVFGLWGHIHVNHINSQRFEERPFSLASDWGKSLQNPETLVVPTASGSTLTNAVKDAYAFAHIPAILKGSNAIEGMICKGVGQNFPWRRFKSYLDTGKMFSDDTSSLHREIMISRTTAKRLQLRVGDPILIFFIKEGKQIPRRFTVKAIYHTGLAEYDRKLAFIPLQFVQNTYNWTKDQVGGVELTVHNLDDMDQINEYLYFDLLPPDMISRTVRAKLYPIFQWLEIQRVNEWVILCLMIIICVINMATGLMILIFERTHLVGLLMALGYRYHVIRNVFLYYAAYIITRGLFWGNMIGLGLCFIQWQWQPIGLDEESYYLDAVPVEFQWLKLILMNILTIGIVMLCLYLPSIMIRRINLVKAVRYK